MFSNGNSFNGNSSYADGSALAFRGTALDPISNLYAQLFAANEQAAFQRMCNLP